METIAISAPASVANGQIIARGTGKFTGYNLVAEAWGSFEASCHPLLELSEKLIEAGVSVYLPFVVATKPDSEDWYGDVSQDGIDGRVLSGIQQGATYELVFIDDSGIPAVGWVYSAGALDEELKGQLVEALRLEFVAVQRGFFDAVLRDDSGEHLAQSSYNVPMLLEELGEVFSSALESLSAGGVEEDVLDSLKLV